MLHTSKLALKARSVTLGYIWRVYLKKIWYTLWIQNRSRAHLNWHFGQVCVWLFWYTMYCKIVLNIIVPFLHIEVFMRFSGFSFFIYHAVLTAISCTLSNNLQVHIFALLNAVKCKCFIVILQKDHFFYFSQSSKREIKPHLVPKSSKVGRVNASLPDENSCDSWCPNSQKLS